MTDVPTLILPLLAQVFWTLLVLCGLAVTRYRALRHRRVVDLTHLSISREGWPDDARKMSNNFDNQFQIPVLFYVVCILATFMETAGPAVTALAWFFVVMRVAHTAVHVTINYVPLRFGFYLASVAALVAMFVMTSASFFGADPGSP
jgi:hypothetical protein